MEPIYLCAFLYASTESDHYRAVSCPMSNMQVLHGFYINKTFSFFHSAHPDQFLLVFTLLIDFLLTP